MNAATDIPDHIAPFIKIVLYSTFHISEVNEEKKSLIRYLRPDALKRMIGDQKNDYIQALSWAIDHPHHSYNKALPDIRFSNEECVKLLKIFLHHIDNL